MRQAITHSANYKWWAFAIIAIGIFVSGISQGSVTVTLPSIAREFTADLSGVQWVVLGYVLATSVLLLPMGRLGDIVGRKQVYIAGFTVFTLSSALAGFATDLMVLVLARVLQGVGAAMIQANMTAMIVSIFPGTERGKAIGLQMSIMGTAMIGGPSLGGLLIDALGWRYLFLVNIPFGIVGILAATAILDKSRFVQDTRGGQRPGFDWLGAMLSGWAMLVLLLAITMGNRAGWVSGPIVAGLVGSVALFAAFVWWEMRTASPMLELALLRRRLVAFGVTAGWVSFVGTSSVMFLLPFYLQDVLGYSPAQMGLFIMAPALGMTFIGPISGRLSDRFGWRTFNMVGLAMMATTVLGFSFVLTKTSSLFLIVPLFAFGGIGGGLFASPNQSSILSAVDQSKYGVISALTHLARTAGHVMGVGLATTIAVATMSSLGVEASLDVVSTDAGAEVADAFMVGMRRAFRILGCLLLVGIALSFFKGERAKAPATEEATEATLRQNPSESTGD